MSKTNQGALEELQLYEALDRVTKMLDEISSKANFNPTQPRVPAGNPDGGQWSAGGGSNGRITAWPRKFPRTEGAKYKPKNDKLFVFGIHIFGKTTKNLLDPYSLLIKNVAQQNKIEPNLVRGIILNEAITRFGAGPAEAITSGINDIFGGYGTYGPAQLGPDARRIVGLNILESLNYPKAITGAAKFLGIQRQSLIDDGVSNPTNAQIATRYNQRSWTDYDNPTKYGIRVEYLIDRFYSDK